MMSSGPLKLGECATMITVQIIRGFLFAGVTCVPLWACSGTTHLSDNNMGIGGGADMGGGAAGASTAGAAAGDSTAGSPSHSCADLPDADQVAVTPRANVNLEQLALKFSDGVIADQDVYDRLVRDLGDIASSDPELADISYFPPDDGKSLLLVVEDETMASMTNGTYHDWDCLNDTYGEVSVRLSPGRQNLVELQLKGIYNLPELSRTYANLGGVLSASPAVGGGGGSTICVTQQKDTWHYVLD